LSFMVNSETPLFLKEEVVVGVINPQGGSHATKG
jgi:hypothetical protein